MHHNLYSFYAQHLPPSCNLETVRPFDHELTQRLTCHTPGTFWITLAHAQVTDLT